MITSSLQRLREGLTLGLITLLPLHALLVTIGTKVWLGTNHAPLPTLALWKEALLASILGLACLELFTSQRWRQRLDRLDALILGLTALAGALSIAHSTPLALVALGVRYDLLAPLSFVLLRRLPWSATFSRWLSHSLVSIGCLTAAYGLLTLLLPQSFFTWLGYSASFHSLYVPDAPLAPFSQVGETSVRRVQSTFGGPNQFGLWLLLPWLTLSHTWLRGDRRAWHPWVWALLSAGLIASLSRSAWIGGIAALACLVITTIPRSTVRRALPRLLLTGIVVIGLVSLFAPKVLVRLSSSRGHLVRPIEAAQTMLAHPWGLGLGSAGPASNRFSDPCVLLRPQDDPSWAKDQPELCVFVGDQQVQPTNRACRCPLHTENWPLQLGVELGFLGFLLWITLCLSILRSGWQRGHAQRPAQLATLAFLAISVGSLTLHAWEDLAIAATVWIWLATCLPPSRAKQGIARNT